MLRLVALVALATVLSTDAICAAEITIGRWCDQPLPSRPKLNQQITIKITERGNAIAISRFSGGKQVHKESLVEQGGNYFRVKDSSSGDGYRVVPSSGDLQLIDNDGLIRVARRLENRPTPGDCIK